VSAAREASARDPVWQYLDELAGALPGSRRLKAPILDEVGDGLAESVATHRSRGEDALTAARSAVAEFGDATDLARALSSEMAGSFAHRFGRALVATGPVIGLGWLTAFALNAGDEAAVQFRPVLAWLPGYLLLMAAVIATAVVATAAGGGPASRVLSIAPGRAAAFAVAAAFGCMVIDAMLLTHLVALTVQHRFAFGFALIPGALSLARLVLVASAAGRGWGIRSATGGRTAPT
jgi:hypothetical protein